MMLPITTLEVEREDDVSSLAEVALIDATIANVEADLTAARATLRTQARAAARAIVAGGTTASDVPDALARVGELEAIVVGLGDVRIVERYHALEKLASDADKTSEGLLAEAEALDARLLAIERGEIDLGEEAKLSDIPRMDALHFAEIERMGVLARRTMLLQEAAQLRDQRAKIKRAHANLFFAEGIA